MNDDIIEISKEPVLRNPTESLVSFYKFLQIIE